MPQAHPTLQGEHFRALELWNFDNSATERLKRLSINEISNDSHLTHLLHGHEVPDSDGVIPRHCCHLLPNSLHRERRNGVLVRAHEGAVVPGLYIQVAQVPSRGCAQDFVAVWTDADRSHRRLVLWGKTQQSAHSPRKGAAAPGAQLQTQIHVWERSAHGSEHPARPQD